MDKKQRLELTWIGKGEEDVLEPRILLEAPEYSYGTPESGNLIIHGDNLLALKSLVASGYAGKVKCIYIDPPYNTGNAFEHYDDMQEHSIWLGLMRQRLLQLKELLASDGVIFVQINDDEGAYLKVLLDEVFGRENFEATFYVKVRHEDRILREDIRYQLVMEQIHCYRKSSLYSPARRPKLKNSLDDYEYNLELIGEPSAVVNLGGAEVEVYPPAAYKVEKTPKGEGTLKLYQIRGSLITQKGSASEFYEKYLRERRESDGLGTLYKVLGMGLKGDGLGYRYILQPQKENSKNGFYYQGRPLTSKRSQGLPYPNYYDLVQLFNTVGYEGGVSFNGGKKPEELLRFLFSLAKLTSGDLVLDSFLGSGTTAAVAQKMGLHYIGIELGEHAYTHCVPRLRKVIDGEDKGGVTAATGWTGGGGFRFCELAPTLLNADEHGMMIISPDYNAEMLAAAMALHEGFRYSPDVEIFWKQGRSTESDYIYTTTQHLTIETLEYISTQLAEGETLLICCTSHATGLANRFPRITVKRIPRMLLGRCAFDPKRSYDLNIISLPTIEDEEDETDE